MSCGLPLFWHSGISLSALERTQGNKSARGQVPTVAAMLSGKCIHVDTAVHKACLNCRMLDDMLEAVGAACEPDRENADALLLPNVRLPRKHKQVCC